MIRTMSALSEVRFAREKSFIDFRKNEYFSKQFIMYEFPLLSFVWLIEFHSEFFTRLGEILKFEHWNLSDMKSKIKLGLQMELFA